MGIKGLVYVPTEAPPGWLGEPSGLQLVANRPLVCHALEALDIESVGPLAVLAAAELLPALADAVAADASLQATPEFIPLGERGDLSGALRAATGFVGESAAVLHIASGLLGQPLEPILGGLAGHPPDLLMLLHHGDRPPASLGLDTERLLGIADIGGEGSRLGLADIAVFGPGVLARAGRGGAVGTEARNAVEPDPQSPLVEVAERLAADGLSVTAGIAPSWCRYSCDPEDLLELNRTVLDRQTPQSGPAPGIDNRIEGRVVIHPTAEVSSSIILGPCLIGAGAQVSDSYVGPYTTLGPHSVLEGSEIVRSVVAEGARIVHVGGRIEGSTIGRGASIFRDFALPRAMRLHVGENDEVALD